MQTCLLENPLLRPLFRLTGRLGLTLLGWKTKGGMPRLKKFILIAAPHSSNWDFIYFLLMIFKFNIPVYWMGKASMFRPPFRGLLTRLGGIPIDRSKASNTVSAMAKEFFDRDHLIITIAPSGTRSRVSQWKTGFYHIACQARVPLVCGFVDYRRRMGGIGPIFYPTGDLQNDLAAIQRFYVDKAGRYEKKADLPESAG